MAMIDKIIQKIKDIGFSHKSDEKKLDELCKKNPDLRNQIVAAYKEGDLKVADMKTLTQMDKEFKDIMDAAKKAEVDPKSLRGRVDKFKEKWNDIDKSKLVKTATALTTVITAVGAAFVFKKHVLDAKKATSDMRKVAQEDYDKYMQTYEDLKKQGEKDGTNYLSENMTKAQITQNLYSFQMGQVSKLVREEDATTNKLSDKIKAFIDKHSKGGSSSEMLSNLEKDSAHRKEKKEEEEKEESIKNRKEAFERGRAQALGSASGKDLYDKTHQPTDAEKKKADDEEVAKAERIARAQQRGRNAATYKDDPEEVAYQQQKGRNRANEEDKKPAGTQKVEVTIKNDKNKNGKNNGKNNQNNGKNNNP
jgi:hypothetical protein